MSKVFAYLDHIFRMVRPRRLLYMAIDGVAPRAKMNQQRSRRFKSAREAEKMRAEALAKGEPEPKGEPFDSNCITPGTPFMARLSEHLRFYVQKKQTEDPLWQKATVILSGHEVRGEGEHKIMEHIRWARGEPGWDPNQTHCLYGLDADLIMLALVTHEPHFCLLREVVKFGGGERGQPSREVLQNPTDDGFLLLHVSLLREYLDQEFMSVADVLPFKYDCERIVDDFVLLCMLVGNDFLPPLPTLDIAEGALNVLFKTYRDLLPSLGGYITGDEGGGTFVPHRLERILVVMGALEADVLAERAADVERQDAKRAKFDNKRGGKKVQTKDEMSANDKFTAAMAALMHGGDGAEAGTEKTTDSNAASEPEGISADPTMMSAAKRAVFEDGGGGIEAWKEMYYREKLELKVGQPAPLAELRRAYFEGLNWVLQYYYRGVASWTWYYPFHYAPMASDLASGMGALTCTFEYGEAFRPFEQLLAVQPPQSCALLPDPYRWLMTAPHSPLAEFFPGELKVDFEGKRNDWEGVVLLPFLEESLVKQCIASVPHSKLTPGQIARNEPGPLIVFQHDPKGTGDCRSTLPKSFAGLFPSKSRMFESMPPGEFPEDRKCFGGDDPLLDGVKLGVDRPPGFPTMHSLALRGELKHAGVNVFGTASKKESLVVRMGRGGDPALLVGAEEGASGAAAYAHLLNRRVHIDWPYLKEAMVVAVSDKSEKIAGRGVRTPHSSSEWGSEVQRAAHERMVARGVDVGQTSVALHVRACEGLVRHPDGSLQKRFGKTDTLLPSQLVIASNASPSPRMQERPALDGDDVKSTGGFAVGDAALFLGRSHFGAVATVASVGEGTGLEVFVEPVPPDTGIARRMMLGHQGGRWENLGALARKLSTSPRALSVLTGPLWIAPTKDAGRFDRIDIGLNLKSGNKGLCVADYTRPMKEGNGWEFSQQCVKLLQDYKRAHPWVFAALQSDPDSGFEGLHLDVALKHLPEPQRLPALNQCKAWIKAQPASRRPLVSKFSRVAAEDAVKNVFIATSVRAKPTPPVALEGVSPLLLMQPVRAGEVLDLYAGGDFELGDRVVMVGDSGSPPFGTRGFICAVHGEAAEIMFETDFVGATDLHGVLPEKRGAMLPTAQVVNLSHPPAMPQLGVAAPDVVVADKKGKKALPKGFKEAWNEANKGGGKGVLAMAAALLPGKGGLPAPGPAPAPRIPVKGSKGFEPGMGRGRGVVPGFVGGGGGPGGIVAPKGAGAPAGNGPDVLAMLGNAAGANQLKGMLGVGGATAAPVDGGAALKGLLGIGGGATAAPPAAGPAVHAMSLEQLERRMGGSAPAPKGSQSGVPAPKPKIPAPKGSRNGAPATPPIKGPAPPGPPPGPGDAAAFWDSLAGGKAPAGPVPVPVPAPVAMPPAPRAPTGGDALKGLLGIGGAAPAPPAPKAPPAPTSAPKSLAEIEALAGVAPVPSAGGDDEDPLAFWKSLQAQHRSEADKLTGTEGGEAGGGGRRRRKK